MTATGDIEEAHSERNNNTNVNSVKRANAHHLQALYNSEVLTGFCA